MDEFKKHLQNFIDYLRVKNYSKRTIEDYSFELNLFFSWLNKKNIRFISEINKFVILDYQAYLSITQSELTKKNFSASTQMNKLIKIKLFFSFLVKADILLNNPARNIKIPSRPQIIKWNLLSLRNIKKILTSIDISNPLFYRDRAIIEILYTTGIRASELCNLKIEDIDYQNNYIRINSGKCNIDRFVPACPGSLEFIKNYIEKYRKNYMRKFSGDYIFLSNKGLKLSKEILGKIIKKHTAPVLTEKKISAHCFRVSAATHMLKNGADIRYIQQFLGHKKIDMTIRYLKLEKSELKRVHSASHPREKNREPAKYE